jgi:hypothetical protein
MAVIPASDALEKHDLGRSTLQISCKALLR